MLTLCSFLRNAFLSAAGFSRKAVKKGRRKHALLLCAGAAFAAAAFTSSGSGGGIRSALTVFAGTEVLRGQPEKTVTEADQRMEGTDAVREGQKIVGDLMVRAMQSDEQNRLQAHRQLLAAMEEIRLEELEDAEEIRLKTVRKAEERAERLEEERIRREEEERWQEEERLRREEEARQEEARAAAVVPMSEEDYQVLLRIVETEAGICDETGRILVANVVFNRVRSPYFPDTVTEVVYQKSQFSPVSNGSIHTCTVTQETIDCVERAMKGEDYSQGALFFMNRKGSSPRNVSWFDSHLTYLFSYQGHEFFK